tara:strand:+ start:404 stop:1390 length:987 start_codon:yes stop_codon:yes gene_type:complete
MIKLKQILYVVLLFGCLKAEDLTSDVSFLDLPLTAKSASLGNAFLSDLGSPTNLFLNPSNILYEDKVNSKVAYRTSISTINGMLGDYNNSNIMFSSHFKAIPLTLGVGYINSKQSDIDYYDDNANYLGEIKFDESALSFGLASRFAGMNVGVSVALPQNQFYGSSISNQNKLTVVSSGFSMNDITVSAFREGWKVVIPNKLSLHACSRSLISEESDVFAENSLYKNIAGFRLDWDYQYTDIYLMMDILSNNKVTENYCNLGLGTRFSVLGQNTIGLNMGSNFSNISNLLDKTAFGLDMYFMDNFEFSVTFVNSDLDDYWITSFKIYIK